MGNGKSKERVIVSGMGRGDGRNSAHLPVWWEFLVTDDGAELPSSIQLQRKAWAIGSSLCGAGQHVVGRLGLTGQRRAAEPAWYCLGRILGLGIQWEKEQ